MSVMADLKKILDNHNENSVNKKPTLPITIRQFERSDYSGFVSLMHRTWYAHYDKKIGMQCARVDTEHCLARTTHAFVAQIGERPVGYILGSLRRKDAAVVNKNSVEKVNTRDVLHKTMSKVSGVVNAHTLKMLSLSVPLLASKEGRAGLREITAITRTDAWLYKQAGKQYDAEIVLFMLAPEAQGQGVGKLLFERMLDALAQEGARNFFLFTDSTCNVGFYRHRGLKAPVVRYTSIGREMLTCWIFEGDLSQEA